MQNNPEDLEFEKQVENAKLQSLLIFDCTEDIITKLLCTETFKQASAQELENFKANLNQEYLDTISSGLFRSAATQADFTRDSSFIQALNQSRDIVSFYQILGSFAVYAPEVLDILLYDIIDLYMTQCNKFKIIFNQNLIVNSPVFK